MAVMRRAAVALLAFLAGCGGGDKLKAPPPSARSKSGLDAGAQPGDVIAAVGRRAGGSGLLVGRRAGGSGLLVGRRAGGSGLLVGRYARG